MSHCILHIGMRKTGSSSIQRTLNGCSSDRFVFADINGHPNHGAALYSMYAENPASLTYHVNNKRTNTELERYISDVKTGFENTITDAQGKTIIFSAEGCRLFTESELVHLREDFTRQFESVSVVAYVRPPAAYITSNFQERVKGAARRVRVGENHFHYQENFEKFDTVFGRENVHLWKFDSGAFYENCVVRDFCNKLGLDFQIERVDRVNESLSLEAVRLLLTYRRFGVALGALNMTGPESRELQQLTMKTGVSKFRFSPDVVRPVLEQNRADIQWMEERLGQSLDEDLGEDRPGDVRDESDLLRPDPVAIGKLLALLGDRAPKGIKGETPEEVALLVHALRANAGSSNETAKRKTRMTEKDSKPPVKQESGQINVAALIAQMQQSNPDLLQGIPKAKAAELLRSAFKQVQEVLAQTQEGTVAFGGLGQFRIRQVQKEVEGKQIARTQIVFKGAEAGKGKQKGGGQA